MDRQGAIAVGVVLVVVLAGCSDFGGPTTDEATPTQEPTRKVTVEGGDLSFDPVTVYRRVAAMHGEDLSTLPAVTVVIEDAPDVGLDDRDYVSRFQRLLGFEENLTEASLAASTTPGTVYLFTDELATPAERERALAHEFTHVIQIERDARQRAEEALRGIDANWPYVSAAVTEGTATYVEHRYAVEYLDAETTLPTWEQRRGNRTQLGVLLIAPYHFGHRYVDGRVDSAEQLADVYDDPPRTTEQLLHGYAPEEELPLDMRVVLDVGDRYDVGERRTKGELFVRLTLEGELGLGRAADAAAGWGTDEVVVLDDADHYVWALRWDTPADADEFEAAMRDFLDAHTDGHGQRDGVAYGVQRAGDDAVVVFVGEQDFVDDASATADAGDVTIHFEENGNASVGGIDATAHVIGGTGRADTASAAAAA